MLEKIAAVYGVTEVLEALLSDSKPSEVETAGASETQIRERASCRCGGRSGARSGTGGPVDDLQHEGFPVHAAGRCGRGSLGRPGPGDRGGAAGWRTAVRGEPQRAPAPPRTPRPAASTILQ